MTKAGPQRRGVVTLRTCPATWVSSRSCPPRRLSFSVCEYNGRNMESPLPKCECPPPREMWCSCSAWLLSVALAASCSRDHALGGLRTRASRTDGEIRRDRDSRLEKSSQGQSAPGCRASGAVVYIGHIEQDQRCTLIHAVARKDPKMKLKDIKFQRHTLQIDQINFIHPFMAI